MRRLAFLTLASLARSQTDTLAQQLGEVVNDCPLPNDPANDAANGIFIGFMLPQDPANNCFAYREFEVGIAAGAQVHLVAYTPQEQDDWTPISQPTFYEGICRPDCTENCNALLDYEFGNYSPMSPQAATAAAFSGLIESNRVGVLFANNPPASATVTGDADGRNRLLVVLPSHSGLDDGQPEPTEPVMTSQGIPVLSTGASSSEAVSSTGDGSTSEAVSSTGASSSEAVSSTGGALLAGSAEEAEASADNFERKERLLSPWSREDTLRRRSLEEWRSFLNSSNMDPGMQVITYDADYEIQTERVVQGFRNLLCGGTPGWRRVEDWRFDPERRTRVDLITDYFKDGTDRSRQWANWNSLRRTIDSMFGPQVEGRLIQFGPDGCNIVQQREGMTLPNALWRELMARPPYAPDADDLRFADVPTDMDSLQNAEDCGEETEGTGRTLMQCLSEIYPSSNPMFSGDLVVMLAVGDAQAGVSDTDIAASFRRAATKVMLVPLLMTRANTPTNECALERLTVNLGGEPPAGDNRNYFIFEEDGWLAEGGDSLADAPIQVENDDQPTTTEGATYVTRQVWSLWMYIGYLLLVLLGAALVVILIILLIRWLILRREYRR